MIDAIFPLLLLGVLLGGRGCFREILVREKPLWRQADLGPFAQDQVERMASRGAPLPDPNTVDWDRAVTQILEET